MKKYIILFLFILQSTFINAQLYSDWKWLHQSPQGNDLRWVKMWDANTIYAIGYKGTFVKTTDRGATWTVQHKAGRVSGIPVQIADLKNAWFFNQNTGIVVGTFGSIFRTTNAGITFDSVPGNPAPTNAVITGISFINDQTGYVISQITNYRLMKTTDGGLNWNANYGTAPPYTNPYDIYAFNENKLLVLNQLGDVCITTNGGNLWNTYAIGSQVNFYKAVFKDANTGFACGDWGRCRFTTNGGFNWFDMAGTMLNPNNHYFDLKYINNTVYLTGNSNYLWKTSNYGNTWDSIQFMSPSAQPQWSNSYYSSDFSVTGDTMITVGARGSIYQSLGTNRLTQCQYLKINSLRDISAFSSSGIVIAVGSPSQVNMHDQILRSSNGGLNWNVIMPSATSSADFYSIDMIDENTGFICGSKSAVYKTTNGGLNWDSFVIPIIPANVILTKVDFVNSQTGWIFSRYVAGNDSTIFKTTNGGLNWGKQKLNVSLTSDNTINSACMLDANNGWLLNAKPRPWKTTNGGTTWDSTALGDNYLAGSLYSIKMLNPTTGYCSGANNRVYRTTNGGASPWSNVSYSSTTVITNYTLEAISAQECLVMGTYGTAYYTSNGGSSWINKNLGASIDDIYGSHITPDRTLYTVTLLNACTFKNSNIFPVGIGNNNTTFADEYELKQNYPNPFNPVTKINFSLQKDSRISLIVYDILGRQISRLVNNEFRKAGSYDVDFSGAGFSSGVYFYKIETDNFSETKKMMLVR